MWWEECCFLFLFPPNSVSFWVQQNKALSLFHFPVFSVSSVFLNYGLHLHGCTAVLIFVLSIYRLLRRMPGYSFIFSYLNKTMHVAREPCVGLSLKLIHSKTLCYIYRTAVQSFCPGLYTLLEMIIGLLMCRFRKLFLDF